MAETKKLDINPDTWTNLSEGNKTCIICIRYGQVVSIHVSAENPGPYADSFYLIGAGAEFVGTRLGMSFSELGPNDIVWARSRDVGDSVIVINGDTLIVR